MLEDPKTDVNMLINPMEVRGIKILMMDLDKKKSVVGNTS